MNKQGALTSQSDRPRNISIPLPNGSVFAFLRKMRTIDGAVGVITSTSLTEMGGGALLLGRVNSPERRKPKKGNTGRCPQQSCLKLLLQPRAPCLKEGSHDLTCDWKAGSCVRRLCPLDTPKNVLQSGEVGPVKGF